MKPEDLARDALYGHSAFTGGTLQAFTEALRTYGESEYQRGRGDALGVRDSHNSEIARQLKDRGFEPGQLQAAMRGFNDGDKLAPFTTGELELGLLDAFASMGGGTVWCGDGSSCAVQIVEHQMQLARAQARAEALETAAAYLDKKYPHHDHISPGDCSICHDVNGIRALAEPPK